MAVTLDPIPHLEAGERAGDDTCIIAMRVIRDLQADADNDRGLINAQRASSRKLRDLFAKHGVDPALDWPKWYAAIEEMLGRAAKMESLLAAARYATDRDNMVSQGLFALAPLRRALAELDA